MEAGKLVATYYATTDEAGRLWKTNVGELIRLRTWDLFEHLLPPTGRVVDVGGGPGTHAEHLARGGYEVALVDAAPKQVKHALAGSAEAPFTVHLGDARALPLRDESFDAVLLMGPLGVSGHVLAVARRPAETGRIAQVP